MSNKLTPTQELAQLKVRQTAAKLTFEADAKATQARLDDLYEQQRPLHESLEQRYQLRRRIARCAKFHQGFSEDAAIGRDTWHRECQSLAREERAALHGIHDAMIRSESCKAECAKSLLILREDLAEMEAEIVRTAKAAGLDALIPYQWPTDPMDE